MFDNASARLFETERLTFKRACLDIAEDLEENNVASQIELNNRMGDLQLVLECLRCAGQMMAIDCPVSTVISTVPIGFFTALIERPRQVPMTEFDWACFYTQDTLNMLAADYLSTEDRFQTARYFRGLATLWDLNLPFPFILSGAPFAF